MQNPARTAPHTTAPTRSVIQFLIRLLERLAPVEHVCHPPAGATAYRIPTDSTGIAFYRCPECHQKWASN